MIERLVVIRAADGASLVEARAASAQDPAWGQGVLEAALARFDEAALLATCERCELYGLRRARRAGEPLPAEGAARLLPGRSESLSGAAAAEHLLRVASGLESRMVGETHVLGQVAGALLEAERAGAAGPVLRALFAAARRSGRRVRGETPLGRIAASYVRATAERVTSRLAKQPEALVGILGSGAVARELALELAAPKRAAGRDPSAPTSAGICLFTRHRERLEGLYDASAIELAPFDSLAERLPALDVLVAATSSPRTLVERFHVAGRARPLLLIDLGVPPNVDPAVAEVAEVSALWLADLAGPRPAQEALALAGAIVEHELGQLAARLARSGSRRRGSPGGDRFGPPAEAAAESGAVA